MKFANENKVISKFNIWDGLKSGEKIDISTVDTVYRVDLEFWGHGLIEKLFLSEKEYTDWKCKIANSDEFGLADWYKESFEQDISEMSLVNLIGKDVYLHYLPSEMIGHELDELEYIKVIGYNKDIRVCMDGSLAFRYSLRSSCEYDNDILPGTIFGIL